MKTVWIYIAGLILIAGCSGYEKLLKSSDYKLKYDKAFEYYNEGDFSKAVTLFDQIATVYRGTRSADSVYFFQAMSYFKQGDFILAGHYFRTFVQTYGGSKFIEDASFMGAYCYYMQSPRPSLDQTSTMEALQAFQLFMIRFPGSDRIEQCRELVTELREKLVEKSYISARLYYDMEHYKASIVALNNSLIDYPDSKFREEIMFLILKSKYLLAENSVKSKQTERYQDTVDEYFSFVSEFSDSDYISEAKRMYKVSAKHLNLEVTNY